ncbi:hypothetical protein [Psychromarinibacter halotolerans]|uniref:Uncharacterized protein n=1 Tax=Psychromarinibacter halotolerans TaxID=1775175 RepID=A0ABV7GUH7_9RHOB|nr:hypothetical protein [Psychromarinibacter halotolerans]MAQ82259.1 hypothetical protein [Maritimibacter sp.]MDF0598455.1 hypothetical protein [Psychromarinibacter halotolerans]
MPKKIARALIEHGRATEWLTACVMLMFAVTLAMPGDTFRISPSYSGFLNLGFDEASIAMPLTLLAGARLTALYINGNWRRSPVIRAFGAAVGAMVFTMLAVTFGWNWISAGGPRQSAVALGTGTGTYLTLALFDFLAAYRSGADVRVTRPI